VHKTKNDLSEPVRMKAVAMLKEHLAQAIGLMLRAKQSEGFPGYAPTGGRRAR
jgi:hypothetical protein